MFVLGGVFTLAVAYGCGTLAFPRLPLSHAARLGLGAAVLSTVVFFITLAGLANVGIFVTAGLLALASLYWIRPAILREPAPPLLLFAVLLPFAVVYLSHVAGPEVASDAMTYHLALPAEYLRLGGFTPRIGFYEILPQGMEMLFTFALALGGASAAKLVHFGLFFATVPLLFSIARRLSLPPFAAAAAGALYFATPVAGITGTCTYNDAALVFYGLLAFYLLLCGPDYRIAAAVAGGFCYAIKITGLPILLAVIIFTRRGKPALAACMLAAPWILRAAVLTGNPVAPLLNPLFPNPYFNDQTERTLANFVHTVRGFPPWEYAFGGGFQGIFGPVLFLLPLSLFALRRRAGRWLLLAALIVVLPAAANYGARFVLPALPFLLLALAVALPRPLLWLTVAAQLVLCFPPVLDRLVGPDVWILRAAPPLDRFGDYRVARSIETRTPPRARIFSLLDVAKLYTTRDVHVYWHATPDLALSEALTIARQNPSVIQTTAAFAPAALSGVRFVPLDPKPEWRIYEAHVFSGPDPVAASPQWTLDAKPNPWEAPLAWDANRATSWRSRSHADLFEARFDHPQVLDRVLLITPGAPFRVLGLSDNAWRDLHATFTTQPAPVVDLRRTAMNGLHRAGFTFLLVSAMGDQGRDMAENPVEWGLQDIDVYGEVHLFRLL